MAELNDLEREELRLLREFWDLFWNGPGSFDIDGKYSGYTPQEMNDLDEAAALVEDHYADNGYFPESKF